MNQELIVTCLKNNENILTEILKKLENIEKRLEGIENSCCEMDSHIDFVNNVYDKLRYPLDFVANKISGVNESLPPSKLLDN
jgi:hypothetical protein